MKQQKFISSLRYALAGWRHCAQREANWRWQLLVATAVLLLAWVLKLSSGEWLFVVMAITLVLAAEAFNTALEQLCDVVAAERHPGIKTVKDVAAGAVLLVAAGAVVGGLIIFLPKILCFFKK